MNIKPSRILGTQDPQKHYYERPGVYALPIELRVSTEEDLDILLSGRQLTLDEVQKYYHIALVKVTRDHRQEDKWYLIGGKVEPHDISQHEALTREVLEETGHTVAIDYFVDRADEFVNAREESFLKQGYFYVVDFGKKIAEAVEPNHTVEWKSLAEAKECISHESASYILEVYTSSQKSLAAQQRSIQRKLKILLE